MSSSDKNLSDFSRVKGNVSGFRIAIIVSEWNEQVTESLFDGAYRTLVDAGVSKELIQRYNVPGSYELPLMAKWVSETGQFDAVICLGCIIRGGTPHFDYVCSATAQGIMDVNLQSGLPVAFGVLTTDNAKQAEDRAGGKHGNKGDEAASTVLKMLLSKP